MVIIIELMAITKHIFEKSPNCFTLTHNVNKSIYIHNIVPNLKIKLENPKF
jgi:hypothetical protein